VRGAILIDESLPRATTLPSATTMSSTINKLAMTQAE
jgi:hypothetical protein